MIYYAAIICLLAQGSDLHDTVPPATVVAQGSSPSRAKKGGTSAVLNPSEAAAVLMGELIPPCSTSQPVLYFDPVGDAVIRRTGTDPNAPVDEFIHNVPDIFAYQIGNWQPSDPTVALFTGCWDSGGKFFRFDIAFVGQVNPPGLWALVGAQFDPYLFGPHPVFGYISFDIDNDADSGGEIDTPQFRFLSNVARFGGLPTGSRFFNRLATGGGDIDGIFSTPPFIERSGEEFHIALFGDLYDPGCVSIFEEVGNGDCIFDPLEIWQITAPAFHRAHGYERFSGAGGDGEYAPMVTFRFESGFAGLNITLVSLVYPLTNAASAQMMGLPGQVEFMDGDDTNQNSIQEGLQDLVDSVQAIPLNDALRQVPSFELIRPWETQNPANFLNAASWDITVMSSMSYVNQDPFGDVFVWTDSAPGPSPGDFNGNGLVETQDVADFDAFVAANDGLAGVDADGIFGTVTLLDFGPNFSLYDLNYDGIIDDADRQSIVIRGDMDADFDIDIIDADLFTRALINPAAIPGSLVRGDMNEDGLLNGRDIPVFVARLLSQP